MWNLSSGEAIDRIEADENPISSLAHYGDMVFSGSLKTIKVCGFSKSSWRGVGRRVGGW